MGRPSELMVAQVSIGVLLLVIIRSPGEYFRLQYLHGDALVIGQVTPYVAGALFAAVALAGDGYLLFRRSLSNIDCFGCRDRHSFVRL
jgi:hypothetical protein